MTDQNIYCPICRNKMYINLDEWGHTPFHLHCTECDINIGMQQLSDTDKWIKYPLKKHMYIEDFPGELIINSYEIGD